MTFIHNHHRWGWSWSELVLAFLGVPVALYGYGWFLTLFYLFFILNALVRKIKGTDRIKAERYLKQFLEPIQGEE